MQSPEAAMALTVVRSRAGNVVAALVEVEAAIRERDVAARFGDVGRLHEIELNAARTACVVLDQGVDDLASDVARLDAGLDRDLADVLSFASEARTRVVGPPTPRGPMTFVEMERVLLQLAGLSEALADQHIDAAIRAFGSPEMRPTTADNESLETYVRRRLEAGRDAVCEYADVLGAREAESLAAASGRRRMRRVSGVLGGAAIAATNAVSALILGPVAAAASAVLGGAATGILRIAIDDD